MANAMSRHQYVAKWPDWPSSAAAAHGRQHHCAAGLVRPVWPDQNALATDKQINERKNGQDKLKDSAIA